jgi:creatinine amidohydrolase
MSESTELARLTWPEARALFARDPVALLPIGSTEPHGPHLPLDVDVTIALVQARRAAELLEAEGVCTLLLPPVAFGVTYYTDGFEGRVGIKPGTLWALLADVVDSLAEQGVRRVVFSNAHLEPEHVQILRGVAADHPAPAREPVTVERAAQVLFPDNTRSRWAKTLGDEFKGGDCHAGRYETSLVLAADPLAVREETRRGLAPVRIDLLEHMKAGVKSFRAAGASAAYCGAPAEASAEEGRALTESLARMIVESVRETWPELFR